MRVAFAALVIGACGRTHFDPADGSSMSGMRVQHGTVTMTTDVFTIVNVAPADSAHTFLVFGYATESYEPRDGLVSGRFVPPDTIELNRIAGNSNVSIAWHLVEWPAASVERGTLPTTAPQLIASIPITPTSGHGFPLVSARADSFDYSGNELVRAHFAASDVLELGVADNTLPDVLEWQVVTAPDLDVREDTIGFGSGQAGYTSTGYARDNTFALATASAMDSITGIGWGAVDAFFINADTLALDRQATGLPLTVTFQHVMMRSGRVQGGVADLDGSQLSIDVPVEPVALDRAVAFVSGNQRVAETPFYGSAPDDNMGVALFKAELAAPGTLRLTRGVTRGSGARVGWFVVELP